MIVCEQCSRALTWEDGRLHDDDDFMSEVCANSPKGLTDHVPGMDVDLTKREEVERWLSS